MCDDCYWKDSLQELEELCLDDDFSWAIDTLQGIAETIEERKHITERQSDAITNIKEAVERRR